MRSNMKSFTTLILIGTSVLGLAACNSSSGGGNTAAPNNDLRQDFKPTEAPEKAAPKEYVESFLSALRKVDATVPSSETIFTKRIDDLEEDESEIKDRQQSAIGALTEEAKSRLEQIKSICDVKNLTNRTSGSLESLNYLSERVQYTRGTNCPVLIENNYLLEIATTQSGLSKNSVGTSTESYSIVFQDQNLVKGIGLISKKISSQMSGNYKVSPIKSGNEVHNSTSTTGSLEFQLANGDVITGTKKEEIVISYKDNEPKDLYKEQKLFQLSSPAGNIKIVYSYERSDNESSTKAYVNGLPYDADKIPDSLRLRP